MRPRGDPGVAVVTFDAAHRFTTWHPTAQRLLGYHAREVLGRPAVEVFSGVQRQPDGRLRIDRNFVVLAWDLERITGYSAADAIGRPLEEFIAGSEAGATREARKQRLRATGAWHGVALMCCADGRLLAVDCRVRSHLEDGRLAGYRAVVRRASPEPGAGVQAAASTGLWRGVVSLRDKDGRPVALDSLITAIHDPGGTVTGYRSMIRPARSTLTMPIPGEEVNSKPAEIPHMMLRDTSHVTRGVTWNGDARHRTSSAMSAAATDRRTVVGHNLCHVRDQLRISQEHLAEVIGIDRTTITHYENGRREPSWGRLSRIAAELETEIQKLGDVQQTQTRQDLQITGRLEPGWFYAEHTAPEDPR